MSSESPAGRPDPLTLVTSPRSRCCFQRLEIVLNERSTRPGDSFLLSLPTSFEIRRREHKTWLSLSFGYTNFVSHLLLCDLRVHEPPYDVSALTMGHLTSAADYPRPPHWPALRFVRSVSNNHELLATFPYNGDLSGNPQTVRSQTRNVPFFDEFRHASCRRGFFLALDNF